MATLGYRSRAMFIIPLSILQAMTRYKIFIEFQRLSHGKRVAFKYSVNGILHLKHIEGTIFHLKGSPPKAFEPISSAPMKTNCPLGRISMLQYGCSINLCEPHQT